MGGKKHGPGGIHRYGNFYDPMEKGETRDRTECCSEETMTATSVVLVVIAVIFIIAGIVLLALGSTESFWRRKVQEESGGTYVDQYRYGNDVLDSKFEDDAYRAIGITMLISALLMILFSVYLCVAVYRGRNPNEEDYLPNRGGGGGGFGGGIGNDML